MPLSDLETEFVAVLREVGSRPGMNTGSQSFERLCGFIQGYLFNRIPIGPVDLPLMLKFRNWLRRHTGIDKEAGWEQFIRFNAVSDYDAFNSLFFSSTRFCATCTKRRPSLPPRVRADRIEGTSLNDVACPEFPTLGFWVNDTGDALFPRYIKEGESMTVEAKIAFQNSLLLIMDRDNGEVPESMESRLVVATSSCIAVGTRSGVDGETSIVMTDEKPNSQNLDGLWKIFSGILQTQCKTVCVNTAQLHTVAMLPVSRATCKIDIWANHNQEPSRLCIVVN